MISIPSLDYQVTPNLFYIENYFHDVVPANIVAVKYTASGNGTFHMTLTIEYANRTVHNVSPADCFPTLVDAMKERDTRKSNYERQLTERSVCKT